MSPKRRLIRYRRQLVMSLQPDSTYRLPVNPVIAYRVPVQANQGRVLPVPFVCPRLHKLSFHIDERLPICIDLLRLRILQPL